MPTASSILTKKTKAEIIAEYEKLLENIEEIKNKTAKVHEPKNEELVNKAREISSEKIQQSVDALRGKINEYVDKLGESLLTGARNVQELLGTEGVLRNRLEYERHIQVTVDMLDILIADHETKKQEFEVQARRREIELEQTLEDKERTWRREQDERQYELERKRRQEKEEFERDIERKKRELAEQEALVIQHEVELNSLRESVDKFPKDMEEHLAKQAKELTGSLKREYEQQLERVKQEWQAEKNVLEIKSNNFQEHIKRLQSENSALKQETERANKRTQELAISVIEGGKIVPLTREEQKEPQG